MNNNAQLGNTWYSPMQQAQNGFVETPVLRTFWPFPLATGAVPWTAKQIKEYAQQQRQQLPEAPL